MNVIGHKQAEELLYSANLNSSRSFLLEGAKGIGKALLAQKFAGHVLGNIERVASRSHSDFLLIEKRTDAEKGTTKKSILVDDARKLRGFLELTPAEGKHRVAIIDSADELNTESANSILKLVEEPPKNAVVVLLSHGGFVLPTIRSRCLSIRLQPLAKDELKKVISQIMVNITESDLELLANIAEGSPGAARMVYENEGLWILDNLAEIFSGYPNLDYLSITKFSEKLTKEDNGWEVFCYLLNWLLNKIARANATGEPLFIREMEFRNNVNMPLFLDEVTIWNKTAHETDVYNLDKKQVIVNTLHKFAECFI